MSSIRIRIQRTDEHTEIRLLIEHPMENGRNRDPLNGELIPAHFIEELTIKLNGATVITADMGGSMAKNPFFSFRLKPLASGDKLTASWVDNLGQADSADYIVADPTER